jgi:hypothetical protein
MRENIGVKMKQSCEIGDSQDRKVRGMTALALEKCPNTKPTRGKLYQIMMLISRNINKSTTNRELGLSTNHCRAYGLGVNLRRHARCASQ